ncbi:MAG: transketolase, partial [SAR324 cluster bacterium]|nr:transketolase [SAR324 cluster bacterium]
MSNNLQFMDMSNALRFLSVDAVQQANSGHPGMPMGMACVMTVLYTRFIKFQASNPDWPDRDRFVLSAGHGSMLLYSLLHLTGYEDFPLQELKRFRQFGSCTAGHPEYGHGAGIETTTGPLGQGIANGVGMALAERMLAEQFGSELVDHHTYVLAGDGCLMEGISHEAVSLAGHLGLGKLIVLFDDNSISIDGPTSLAVSDDQLKRFESSRWHTQTCDGHDSAEITAAIETAQKDERPSLIAFKTQIGYGAPNKAGTASAHGAPLGEEEIEGTREQLNWPHPPFNIPEKIQSLWQRVGKLGNVEFKSWLSRLQNSRHRAEFERVTSGELPAEWKQALMLHKQKLIESMPKLATRKASQEVLNVIAPALPELTGGSADLSGSNLTRAANQSCVQSGDFNGNYIHFGVREHAMAAVMNGMALHGGLIPYGGTFLVFSDYCRPAIRLSALMRQRVIYVMTHDSIGLGEDGPTHQPVEHLASLRAIPNLNVFRPADSVETAECWEIALETEERPSILSLSRQSLPALRSEFSEENLCHRGGYLIGDVEGERQVTLIASGSEVSIAIEAKNLLQQEGIEAAVVSMPCLDLFLEEAADYRKEVLGEGCAKVVVEAA